MRISERCYAVTGLGYSPPWCVNAGIIAGDEITLVIDAGGNALAAATVHGYATAIRPSNNLRVINTEKHFDHILGNSYFRERGIDIWGHAGISRTQADFETEVAAFNSSIPDRIRRERGEATAFFHGTTLVNPNFAILEDTQWDLGRCAVRIILTPGHTETNLVLWVPDESVLYCGDCLISAYLPNLDAGGIDDWKLWLQSLEKIEALNPSVVVAGHGPVLRDANVGRSIAAVRRVLEESIARGASPTWLQL